MRSGDLTMSCSVRKLAALVARSEEYAQKSQCVLLSTACACLHRAAASDKDAKSSQPLNPEELVRDPIMATAIRAPPS